MPVHPFNLHKLDYEWQVGYSWYLSRIEGNTVMDGGCLAHMEFGKILTHLGYTVIGVDIAPMPVTLKNLYFLRVPVWDIPYCQPVDTVISNSLFEHLGLPCYGQPRLEDGDFKTAAEFHRVLKPGGCLLMQVPFGKKSHTILNRGEPFYRIYDSTRLHELLEGLFDVEESEFYMRDGNQWLKVNVDIANRIDYTEGLPPCLVFIKARAKG